MVSHDNWSFFHPKWCRYSGIASLQDSDYPESDVCSAQGSWKDTIIAQWSAPQLDLDWHGTWSNHFVWFKTSDQGMDHKPYYKKIYGRKCIKKSTGMLGIKSTWSWNKFRSLWSLAIKDRCMGRLSGSLGPSGVVMHLQLVTTIEPNIWLDFSTEALKFWTDFSQCVFAFRLRFRSNQSSVWPETLAMDAFCRNCICVWRTVVIEELLFG